MAANILMAAMLVAAISVGAKAEGADDIATLNKQVVQLYSRGKYQEATALAGKALAAAERVLGAEHPLTLASVNNLALIYHVQGRYAEAEPLYRRALETYARVLGPENPYTLASLGNLAELYRLQGRYAEAEPLYHRALAARERVLGAEHPDTLLNLNNLGLLYLGQARYADAEPLFRRALAGLERVLGAEHQQTLTCLGNLAAVYDYQGRYAEAEPLYRRAFEAKERALGPNHPDTLVSLNNLAELHRVQGRYAEAEPLFLRALPAMERVLGVGHPQTLTCVTNLASLYHNQGRYSEAEPLFRRAVDTFERVAGPEHPYTLMNLNSLAALYKAQGRYAEAEPLYRRALAVRERVLGPNHPDTLQTLNNLASVYHDQGRYDAAEPLYRRALEARERALGADHPDTIGSLNNLAELYRAQGRYAEAEPLYRRALETSKRVLGVEHPKTLTTLGNLGLLYDSQGRYAEAAPLYRGVLEAKERVLGPEHPETLLSLSNLAFFYFAQRDWPRAAEFWRRSTAGIASRVKRGTQEAGQGVTGKKRSEAEQLNWQFWGLVKAVHRLSPEGSAPGAKASRETFETAQWALSSEAAASLAQMAARGAKGDPKLAALVRERQDLAAEWQKRDGVRNEWLGKAADKRDAKAEAENNARLTGIDARISEIDKELAVKFPDYAALANPVPHNVEEVQAQLGADEALVLFLDTDARLAPAPEETFIWVVTKTDMRWVRTGLGTAALAREVQSLRCGLDAAVWDGGGWQKCRDLTGSQPDRDANGNIAATALPFNLARAHALYHALFGPAQDLIKGKRLLLVPSGPLTQLPFQVLVTAASADSGWKSASWLIREHALTVLPAVSSLKALRGVARPGAATKPMIGFGNPLLDGDQSDPQFGDAFKRLAQRARDNQRCHETPLQRVAAFLGGVRGVTPIETRGGLAQVSHIRMQAPLPETGDELCAVARDLKADASELRLGARATEREVKTLSASGQLAQYRIVHFATHGALAGELRGTSEPGLILTPPDTASEEDDGYLSASEIAGLKLDADWVILSACNTAAGDTTGGQALSGLARAFIYAQARALLVSHWSVDSAATVKLITTAMREMASDSKAGRAEALRRAMLALIDKGEDRQAHPAYWAPFAVVGEGAR